MFADTRIGDLWALTAAQLHDEDRHNIDFNRPDELNILVDLHALTEKSKSGAFASTNLASFDQKQKHTVMMPESPKLASSSVRNSHSWAHPSAAPFWDYSCEAGS